MVRQEPHPPERAIRWLGKVDEDTFQAVVRVIAGFVER